jgi:hypothetical protein
VKSLKKLSTLLVVDEIEPALENYRALGYTLELRVPETGTLGFVILRGPTPEAAELMMQTRASLAEDLPIVAKKKPSFLLYADVDSLAKARRGLTGVKVLVEERKTFYGATESWLELPEGTILGLAKHD